MSQLFQKWPKLVCLILFLWHLPCAKKEKNTSVAITEGKKILRMSTKTVWCPLRQDNGLPFIGPKHCEEQLCRGRDIIKETFRMPLDSEVEAN